MSGLPFHKYESIGNDLILVEEAALSGADLLALDSASPLKGEGRVGVHSSTLQYLATTLCDRRFGVGSDGLLVWALEGDAGRLRMFNPDGTEDFCGNGLRCAALHARRSGFDGETLQIDHLSKSVQVAFTLGGWIDVRLPPPSFDPEDVPLTNGVGEVFDRCLEISGRTLPLCSLTTGSAHTVIFCAAPPSDDEFKTVSTALETHAWFPERTSVIWAWPAGDKRLEIRIWERGAGETLGCGTGSAAAAACLFRKHIGLQAVAVQNPGGECVVGKGPAGGLIVSARASHVFSGETLAGVGAGSPCSPLRS